MYQTILLQRWHCWCNHKMYVPILQQNGPDWCIQQIYKAIYWCKCGQTDVFNRGWSHYATNVTDWCNCQMYEAILTIAAWLMLSSDVWSHAYKCGLIDVIIRCMKRFRYKSGLSDCMHPVYEAIMLWMWPNWCNYNMYKPTLPQMLFLHMWSHGCNYQMYEAIMLQMWS